MRPLDEAVTCGGGIQSPRESSQAPSAPSASRRTATGRGS